MSSQIWVDIFVTAVTCGGGVFFCWWFSRKLLRVMSETVDECVKATQEQAYRAGLGDGFEMYERWRALQDVDSGSWDPAVFERIKNAGQGKN